LFRFLSHSLYMNTLSNAFMQSINNMCPCKLNSCLFGLSWVVWKYNSNCPWYKLRQKQKSRSVVVTSNTPASSFGNHGFPICYPALYSIEVSLPCTQQSTIALYSDPAYFSLDSISLSSTLIIFSFVRLGLPSSLSFSGVPTKTSLPCHAYYTSSLSHSNYLINLITYFLLEDYRLTVERRSARPNDPEGYASGSVSSW
jgi:hypothetical protein